MSKPLEVKILAHGEVQKKIIQSAPRTRSKDELLGPFNKFRDENFEIYNKKKKQFLDTAKSYYKLNQETLTHNKKRLLEDYRDLLNCEFLKEESEPIPENEDVKTGPKLIRQRTERQIHQMLKCRDKNCTMEPWFTRYLKLNKFITAARKIILKNRLLKVLEKLKTVTEDEIEELERRERKYLNVSYAEIFDKYM